MPNNYQDMTINQQLIRSEIKDYVLITIGLLLYASAFTVFLMPYEIVTGGVTGLSAIITMQHSLNWRTLYDCQPRIVRRCIENLGHKVLDEDYLCYCGLVFHAKSFAQELMPLDASGNFYKDIR